MLKIAICDDCSDDRKTLSKYINAGKPGIEFYIYEYESGPALLKAMEETRFSVVFLDIQMKDMNGHIVAQEIRKLDSRLILAFYTGLVEPSPESFVVSPYRYIMKNLPSQTISQYVKDVLEKAKRDEETPRLFANVNKQQFFIDPKYVLYIEKYKKSSRVHLVDDAYELYGIEKNEAEKYPDIRVAESLESIYRRLKDFGFGCPHSSYIINFYYLCKYSGNEIYLINLKEEFSITRGKSKAFHKEMKDYIQSKCPGGMGHEG